MKLHVWLYVSGLLFIGASASSLHDYYKNIEGPITLGKSTHLVEVSGRPITAECKSFQTPRGARGIGLQTFADPQVKFSYGFGGQAYQSERYVRTKKYSLLKPEECSTYVKAFLDGQSVPVWVDPENPSYAVLDPFVPTPWIEFVFLALGGLAFVTGGYVQVAKASK